MSSGRGWHPGTRLLAGRRSLLGFSNLYGISNVDMTEGAELLGFQVLVKLLGASPVMVTLLLDVFVFV